MINICHCCFHPFLSQVFTTSLNKDYFVVSNLPAGATLYRKLKAYLMTEEQLQEHGYPWTNPEAPGKAIIYNLPEKKVIADRE